MIINNIRDINDCSGEDYSTFISYTLDNSDYFMLVYVNYYGEGLSSIAKQIKTVLNNIK